MADQTTWQPPTVPDYYGTGDTVQAWLDQNLANYLEQNPGAIDASRLLGSIPGLAPTGVIFDYGSATAPDGYVLCDGSTYDGTNATYLNLWAVIGVTYGGSGQSSFKVPDAQGRFAVMQGSNAAVNALNANDGLVNASRKPGSSISISGTTGGGSSHSHGAGSYSVTIGNFSVTTGPTGGYGGSGTISVAGTSGSESSHTHSFSGSGTAAPGFIVFNKIIKL